MPHAHILTAGNTGTAGSGSDSSDWGGSQVPPGAQKLLEMVHWLGWGVTGVLVAAVLISAARMAIAIQGGRGGHEGVMQLAWSAFGCVVAGSATEIVSHLLK